MGFYDRHVLPRLISLAMRQRMLAPYRRRVVGQAKGRVLEIGVGAGANLPYYGPDVEELFGVEPAESLVRMTQAKPEAARIRLVQAPAEDMPFEDASFDTAVMSWTLCSIADSAAALAEVRRVLKPGGVLLFVEHGRAPEPRISRSQDRLTPLWRRIAGGCRLNLAVDQALEGAGFRIEALSKGYLASPNAFTYLYEGRATTNLYM